MDLKGKIESATKPTTEPRAIKIDGKWYNKVTDEVWNFARNNRGKLVEFELQDGTINFLKVVQGEQKPQPAQQNNGEQMSFTERELLKNAQISRMKAFEFAIELAKLNMGNWQPDEYSIEGLIGKAKRIGKFIVEGE